MGNEWIWERQICIFLACRCMAFERKKEEINHMDGDHLTVTTPLDYDFLQKGRRGFVLFFNKKNYGLYHSK